MSQRIIIEARFARRRRPAAHPALGGLREDRAEIRLFYATDRNDLGERQPPPLRYGNDRTRGLSYGVCTVSIPLDERLSGQESPGWFEASSPGRHVLLIAVQPAAGREEFVSGLRGKKRAFAAEGGVRVPSRFRGDI